MDVVASKLAPLTTARFNSRVACSHSIQRVEEEAKGKLHAAASSTGRLFRSLCNGNSLSTEQKKESNLINPMEAC